LKTRISWTSSYIVSLPRGGLLALQAPLRLHALKRNGICYAHYSNWNYVLRDVLFDSFTGDASKWESDG
jgi:hypothetical protein